MKFKKTLAVLAAAASLAGTPAVTFGNDFSQDERIRRLDIMLMVTSLRCRMGRDDFQANYRNFTATHLQSLNASARRLEKTFVAKHGAKGAKRALDRISVSMANEYGQGHPWLNCAELKEVARDLSKSKDPVVLAQAADQLLGPRPLAGSRWARR